MQVKPSALLNMALSLLISFFSLTAWSQVAPTPGADRMRSLAQRQTLFGDSLLSTVSFRSIGPTIMSGRVVDVEANPNDPTEFYVAYATGGLWHTTNNGQSFTPIMDSLDILFLGDIAINWNTNPRIIWAGTGEANSSRSSYAGTGMYRSNDNGVTWEPGIALASADNLSFLALHNDSKDQFLAFCGAAYISAAYQYLFYGALVDKFTQWPTYGVTA